MLDTLLASLCVLCGQWVPDYSVVPQVCPFCLESLPWNSAPCDVCGLPLEQCRSACVRWPIRQTVSPLEYTGAVRRWVMKAKNHSGLTEASVLGSLLALAVSDAYQEQPLPSVLVPVPLSWQRLLRRGHNQAILVARPVCRATGVTLIRSGARRHQHTPIQPGHSAAQRSANVRKAFSTRRRFEGAHVAIVDDVMTTGATCIALARCLLNAGATRVDAWCAARAFSRQDRNAKSQGT